jgi:spermidine synthase
LNSFGEWGFHLAVKDSNPLDLKGLQLADVKRRFLTDEVFLASQVFSLDTAPIPSPVNSIFEPKLYLLYEAGLQR